MKLRLLFTCFLSLSSFIAIAGINGSLEFIENKGQWDASFMYKANTVNGDIFLRPDQFIFIIGDNANSDKIEAYHHGIVKDPQVLNFHEYRMHFVNAHNAIVIPEDKLETYYNYFLGNDRSRWHGGIHPYRALQYNGLYDGIDMHVSSAQAALKYDFIVAPGADPAQIQLRYEGADNMHIDGNGDLKIETSVGEIQEIKPYAYQYNSGQRIEVPCYYKLKNNTVTYYFPRGYNTAQQLIIDPEVIFATFTGSTADNFGYTATYDKHGNFYAGGIASLNLGGSYPVTPGAFQEVYGGGNNSTGMQYATDIAIMKFSPDGVNRIWATYLGGSNNEQPHSMIVDSSDNLLVLGRTYSGNYPYTTGCFDSTYNGGADLVLTKFNSACTGLLASTYIGGSSDDGVNGSAQEFVFDTLKYNYYDDVRSEVILDNSNNVYVTACTRSLNFPVTLNAVQNSIQGLQDAIVFKLDSGLSNLLWSTYLGGHGKDAGYTLVLDEGQQNIYIAGGTTSSDFITSPAAIYPSFQGGTADGFITRFRNDSTYALLNSTYIGTPNYDQCFGIKTDLNGFVYTMGQSLGGHFPVTPGVYNNPNSCQFVMKLDSGLNANIFSTVYGSGDSAHTNISPLAFFVDSCENVYISGWGGRVAPFADSSVGNVGGMPVTANAIQTTTDSNDLYFIVFGSNATSLLYATFYGASGTQHEHAESGTSRFDKNGVLYQSICASCGGEPFLAQPPNVWSLVDSSTNCNQAALKINFNMGPVICGDTVTVPNRIKTLKSLAPPAISPNPNQGHFTIALPQDITDAHLTLTNTIGQIILSKRLNTLRTDISIPPIPGLYFVEINYGTVSHTAKVLVQ